jgi:DNA-binding transcriptional regulator YdaS (Cro superfamily)
VPVICDESPTWFKQTDVDAALFNKATAFLADDEQCRTMNHEYRTVMVVWVGVLREMLVGGCLTLEQAVEGFFLRDEAMPVRDEIIKLFGSQTTTTTAHASISPFAISMVFGPLRQALPRPGSHGLRSFSEGTPVAELSPDELERHVFAIRVLWPLYELAQLVIRDGEDALVWRDSTLIVQLPTPEAIDLKANGALVLDATPNEYELRALGRPFRIERLVVPDGAPITRRILYRNGMQRRGLCPGGEPDWRIIKKLVAEVLDIVKATGARKVLLASLKKIVTEWRSGSSPCEPLFKNWSAAGGVLAFTHYGAGRGMNAWENFDASITLGELWLPPTNTRTRAVKARVGHLDYARDAVARDLGQTHGRLRAPSRTRPAQMLHVGTVSALGWHTNNTEVVPPRIGRPGRTSAMEVSEVKGLVKQLGGVRRVADMLGVSPSTVTRWCQGLRSVGGWAAQKMRAAASRAA